MTPHRILSLANKKVRLEFLAMERSLRATGCNLPLSVIPYDDDLFDLPPNAEWVDLQPLADMLRPWSGAGGAFGKLAALCERNVAFFDADIIHLKNPQEWLAPFDPDFFLVADTEFSKGTWTYTTRTRSIYRQRGSTWVTRNFNTGFFAFTDLQLSPAKITQAFLGAERDLLNNTHIAMEQPSLNYLAHVLNLRVVNACLPPYAFESTMAVDYGANYLELLSMPNGAPFVHFAGVGADVNRPVANLIFKHLQSDEGAALRMQSDNRREMRDQVNQWPVWAKLLKRMVPLLDKRFELSWKGFAFR